MRGGRSDFSRAAALAEVRAKQKRWSGLSRGLLELGPMNSFARPTAIALAGFCTFLDLYAPQSVLPLVARQFSVGAVETSHLVSATTLAVALVAPFTGAVADMIGRKRVIVFAMFALLVPTLMIALATTLAQMVFWRFVQGLLLPPIFVVTVAYIGDEFPASEATGYAGIYMAASGVGGFLGRFLTGILGERYGVSGAFHGLAGLTLIAAISVAVLLPREKNFVASRGLAASLRNMTAHLGNPKLLATYAVGFGVLFNFVAVFTYVNFHLAAPPYNLSAAGLGAIFVVYLSGVVVTPLTGRWVKRWGRRKLVLLTIVGWLAGFALTLAPSLALIIAGLTLAAAGGFISQTVATSYVAVTAHRGRSSAVGLYVTCYYIGGSAGAVLPGIAWNWAGWPAAVAVMMTMLALMAIMVLCFWRDGGAPVNPADAIPEL
jgi:YNFM family putative membrane transporter